MGREEREWGKRRESGTRVERESGQEDSRQKESVERGEKEWGARKNGASGVREWGESEWVGWRGERVMQERECGKSGECEGKGRVCDDEGVSVRGKD